MRSQFGDVRLDKRLEQVTEQISAVPVANLPKVLVEWSSLKAGYRFMNNQKVTHEKIIETEKQDTWRRIEQEQGRILLAVQDTTSFNFANRQALAGLGVLEDNCTPGFFAHTTLGVTEQGVPIGILDQQVWSRVPTPKRDKEAHKRRPITEKESFKWLEALHQLPEHLPQQIVTICDREADVYELFQDAHNREEDFIVRAVRNRRLEEAPLLREHLGEISPAATYQLTVQRQDNQAEREATVELRYATVTLLPPKRLQSAQVLLLHPLVLQVVEVREMNAPDDVKPLHWILLTTLAVNSLEDAYRIVRFYTYRWLVERFHYVLKSGGCHFEDSQLRTVEALHRLLGVCSRAAWRLLWLTYQARQSPDVPCTVALTQTEWQALTAFSAHSHTPDQSPPTLRQAVRAIAKLGGFIGRKSDGEPGVKTLWRGWQRLQDITAAWSLFHPSQDVGNV
jgi:hypothetical protein